MARPSVFITGAAGVVGEVLRAGLADHYRLSGADRVRLAEPGFHRADLRKPGKLARLLEGVDVVVDLAAVPASPGTWGDVYENNIPATMNVLEAARSAGVRRVVFASSNHVTGMYERDEPYASIVAGRYEGLDSDRIPRLTSGTPVRPDGPYGVGKALGEAAGRFYAEEHELSVICLRIGTTNREDRPRSVRHLATLLTHADLVRLVRAAIEAPEGVRFGIFYGVSANKWRFWDVEEALEAIGYDPKDDAEVFRDQTTA